MRAAALEETLAETRAERGQLENYKQLAREQEASKVCRTFTSGKHLGTILLVVQ